MSKVWSDDNTFDLWLQVEIAASQAWTDLGVVPPADMEKLRSARFDRSVYDRIFEETKHDIVSFTRAVSESLGPESRWIHHGLTSNDVKDTGLGMQMTQSVDIIDVAVKGLMEVLKRRAIEFINTPCIGRSHGIHAEPMSFGLKLAMWWDEMRRNRERLAGVRKRVAVCMLSGPVGTFASVPPEIEESVARQLDLEPAPISNQVIQRDRHAEFVQVLALIAATLDKMATEIRALQRTEVGEVQEPFGTPGFVTKGSSSMPHKRNPELSERICGLARVVRSNSITALENVALWHERDISHSSAERVILPDSALAVDYILHLMTGIIDGMLVFPDRMMRNLELTRGLVFSPRVMLALVEAGMDRKLAYDTVQRCAMRSWDDELDFREIVKQDETVRKHLPAEEIDPLFDYGFYLKHVNHSFARLGFNVPIPASVASQGMSRERAVYETSFSGLLHRGKVRDTYDLGAGLLLMVATDRISAFDIVMSEPVPGKGIILTQMSQFWFSLLGDIVPNHMVSVVSDRDGMKSVPVTGALAELPDGYERRATVIKKARRIDMECVVRNYLAGSAWAEYRKSGTVNGAPMPAGMREAERLPEPMFTPSTKAEHGHDMPLTRAEGEKLVGKELYRTLEEMSIKVFSAAHDYAKSRGMILADTKFEFGYVDGELTLIDEVLTPDSSRFWDVNDWKPGRTPPAYDKQYLRDWLLTQEDWNREPPAPSLPSDVVAQTQKRYMEAFTRLTGESLIL